MDLRPSFKSMQGAFGLPASVTLPDGTVISATVVWLPPVTEEVPSGNDLRRAEARKVLCIAKSEVPQVFHDTQINAAEEKGGAAQNWKVNGMDRVDSDHHRVFVVPA